MKRIEFILPTIFLAIVFFSCEEIGPQVNGNTDGGNDTTQLKHVLIEDMTGVRCPNCPNGRKIIDTLIQDNPGRIEVAEIHYGFYAIPYSFSQESFATTDGTSIADNIDGPVVFQPSGAVDRKIFAPDKTVILLDKVDWVYYVQQELLDTLKVKLNVSNSYTASSGQLTVTVDGTFLQDVTDDVNLTVLITESNIVDPQEQADLSIDTFYVHNDVLRDAITAYNGEAITGDKSAGATFSKQYAYTIPVDWVAANCKVVALVSKSIGMYDVLQTVSAPVQ